MHARYFCVLNSACPANPATYSELASRRCLEFCPPGTYALDTSRACTATCPKFYFVNQTLTNIENRCVAKCPNNTFLDSNNFCVKSIHCPANEYGNPLTGNCVADCPGNGILELFADTNPNVKLCVYVCPKGYYIQNITGSRECVLSCPATYYIDYVRRSCVQNCSEGTFSFNNGSCV